MLDVHPPHHPAHTWRDFFIHIATIVVGLLIAVGLEQTVEWFHHRHEIAEAREALKQEREENSRLFTGNVALFRSNAAMLRNDFNVLLYLQQHPGTPEEKLPGVLIWFPGYYPVIDSAWKNAQQTQVLSLFSRDEAEDLARLYYTLGNTQTVVDLAVHDALVAGAYAALDPDPSHLTPAQVDKEIELTKGALAANYEWGIWLMLASRDYPDFHGGITFAEIQKEGGFTRTPGDDQKLAAARARTGQFLAPTNAAIDAVNQQTGLRVRKK